MCRKKKTINARDLKRLKAGRKKTVMCLSDASNLHAKRYNDVVCHLIQKANNEIQYGGEKYLSWEGLVDQNMGGSHFILTFLSIWV